MEANSDLLLIDVVIFENSFWAEICKSAYWAVFLATAKRLRIPAKRKTNDKPVHIKTPFQKPTCKWKMTKCECDEQKKPGNWNYRCNCSSSMVASCSELGNQRMTKSIRKSFIPKCDGCHNVIKSDISWKMTEHPWKIILTSINKDRRKLAPAMPTSVILNTASGISANWMQRTTKNNNVSITYNDLKENKSSNTTKNFVSFISNYLEEFLQRWPWTNH